MRSLLIQATSVEKAVEKAWQNAGLPTEFTIKILDFGEKGFLGISKKKAIVSIIYEPQKQTSVSKPQPMPQPKAKQPQPQPQKARLTQPEKPQARPQKPEPKQEEVLFWSDDLIADVSGWLKETASILGITIPVKSHVNKKNLTLCFTDHVFDNHEEERIIFSALAALIMQFLKKKYKKKFHGYQLLITSKRGDNR